MPKYVVEREVPGVGASTSERSQISALNLSGTINELGGRFLTQFRMEMNDAVARLRTAQPRIWTTPPARCAARSSRRAPTPPPTPCAFRASDSAPRRRPRTRERLP